MYLKNIGRFFFLVLLQVLILNNIQFSGYINPYLYIYFILLLPSDTPKWMLLLLSFLLGMCIDIFVNTPGLNAAACVMMGFARPFVIRWISTGNELQIGYAPSLRNQGPKWFLYYTISLILIHHTTLFYLEIFRMDEFFSTFVRMLLSAFFTLVLVLVGEYLFYPKEKK